jgi:hypothetical protein
MNVSLRLYKGVVYLPTTYAISAGFYFDHSPLESIPIEQPQRLQQAIRAALGRGNPLISGDEARAFSSSSDNPVLKAMGARSWDALDRQTEGLWSLREKNAAYQIRVNRPMEPRGWHEDKTKRVQFPPGTPVDEAIARLIAMIQECAQQ